MASLPKKQSPTADMEIVTIPSRAAADSELDAEEQLYDRFGDFDFSYDLAPIGDWFLEVPEEWYKEF